MLLYVLFLSKSFSNWVLRTQSTPWVNKIYIKKFNSNLSKQKKSYSKSIEISISKLGSELKDYIMAEFDIDCSGLKMICNGKVIREDVLLSSQNIKVSQPFKFIFYCYFLVSKCIVISLYQRKVCIYGIYSS